MKSEELFKILTNVLPSGLLVLSEDNRVIIWNTSAEDITFVKKQEVLGKTIDELPQRVLMLLNPESENISFDLDDFDSRHIKKDYHKIGLDNNRSYVVVIFTDVTEMIMARQDLEQHLMETSESKDLMEEQAADLAMALAEVDEKNDIIQGQNKKMIDELKMAGNLQKSLLPNIYESLGGVSFSSRYIPSIHIGGDLYDVAELGHGLTGFIIADVSGHGVAAALVSSMFKMSYHALAANVASPKILLHMLNQEFNPILAEDYITSFYVISDRNNKSITFSNAGHPYALLYKKSTSKIMELDTDGFFLGMFDDGVYDEVTVTDIENGDALLLYTDCLIETENKASEPFGMTRLKDLFKRVITQYNGQDVIDRIEAELRVFNANDSFNDDFTVLLLEFWGDDASDTQEEDTNITDGGNFIEF